MAIEGTTGTYAQFSAVAKSLDQIHELLADWRVSNILDLSQRYMNHMIPGMIA